MPNHLFSEGNCSDPLKSEEDVFIDDVGRISRVLKCAQDLSQQTDAPPPPNVPEDPPLPSGPEAPPLPNALEDLRGRADVAD